MKQLILKRYTALLSPLWIVIAGALFLSAPAARAVTATYNSATDIPVSGDGYTASGQTVDFTLNYSPAVGTTLTVVDNTGTEFIDGVFTNLANGQRVELTYNGFPRVFIAWYYGGDGNDLVLLWPDVALASWGKNTYGQLGDGTTMDSAVAVRVDDSGVLAGRTVVQVARGTYHSLALCADGSVATWGYNGFGQLGDNSYPTRSAPVLVNATSGTSALFGKTVVAVAAGDYHSLALCSDGTVAAWGSNNYGQLGTNGGGNFNVPTAVNTTSGTSALFGKTVTAIAAGGIITWRAAPMARWLPGVSMYLASSGTARRRRALHRWR